MLVNQADRALFRRRLTGGFYNHWRGEFGEPAWSVLEAQVGRLV